MDAFQFWEAVIKSVLLIFILLTGFAYTTYMERKLLGRFQVRYGPNRVGPFGLLQPIADAVKLIFKEELIPAKADKLIFILAPILTAIPAWVLLAVVPFGGTVTILGRPVSLSIAGDLNTGILYLSAWASISVYGIVLAGWSSNNKYATMGGIRSTAQMISYELALGLAWVGPILMAASMSLQQIVSRQSQVAWFAVVQPIGFIIFLIAVLAEINRPPFDMPEAEQELTAGYHVEYSGMKFALFMLTEYTKMIVVSVLAATLFLGGYDIPFIAEESLQGNMATVVTWLGPVALFVKVFLLLFGIIWVRATLPRIRYDRLMAMGWKVLLPVALFNVFLVAAIASLFPGLMP
jgi:NADH-quinone oxidoreductase subunit H